MHYHEPGRIADLAHVSPGNIDPERDDGFGACFLTIDEPTPAVAVASFRLVADLEDLLASEIEMQRMLGRPVGGRIKMVSGSLFAADGHYLDAKAWRAMPIAQIETLVNGPRQRLIILHDLTDGRIHEYKVSGVGPSFWQEGRKAPLRLPIPEGRKDKGDAFYSKVAAAYARLAAEGRPPARTLAEINGVPETTISRWVREARRRRLLGPAGGKGRIG